MVGKPPIIGDFGKEITMPWVLPKITASSLQANMPKSLVGLYCEAKSNVWKPKAREKRHTKKGDCDIRKKRKEKAGRGGKSASVALELEIGEVWEGPHNDFCHWEMFTDNEGMECPTQKGCDDLSDLWLECCLYCNVAMHPECCNILCHTHYVHETMEGNDWVCNECWEDVSSNK